MTCSPIPHFCIKCVRVTTSIGDVRIRCNRPRIVCDRIIVNICGKRDWYVGWWQVESHRSQKNGMGLPILFSVYRNIVETRCNKTKVRYRHHLQREHGVFVKVFRFNQEQRKIIHAFIENESISLLHEQFLEQSNSTYIRELKNGTTTRFHELRGNVLLWSVHVPTIAMYSHISRNTNLKIQTSTIRSVSQSACFGHFTFPSPWWHYKFNL